MPVAINVTEGFHLLDILLNGLLQCLNNVVVRLLQVYFLNILIIPALIITCIYDQHPVIGESRIKVD